MKINLLYLVSLLFFLPNIAFAQNLKKYYYAPQKFNKTKVYYYKCKDDNKYDQFWAYTFDTEAHVLETLVFGPKGQKLEDFRESYRKDASYAESFKMIENNQIKSIIIKDSLWYHWKDTSSHSLKMLIPEEGSATVFTKRTKYLGKEKIKIGAKTYSCIKFQEDFRFDIHQQEKPYQFQQISYYAKCKGLVKFQRNYGQDIRTHELAKIESLAEWNKRFSTE